MKYYRLIFFLILFSSCSFLSLAQRQQDSLLIITNKSNENLTDQLVVISHAAIIKKIGTARKGMILHIEDSRARPMVIQLDDLNGDGKWDEVAFLYSFLPREKAVFKLFYSSLNDSLPVFKRAHVRHRKKLPDNTFGLSLSSDIRPFDNQPTDFSKTPLPPYLTEGPAWENDKVGFRIYFDIRNEKDIWGKRTPAMVLDQVGADPRVIYHNLDWWGMDILRVGKSLGAGSLALVLPDGKGRDTLIRIGGSGTAAVRYEKIADGPVRAIFRMIYKGCPMPFGLKSVDLTDEISIWGGQYFYEGKVTLRHAPANARLAVGIADFYENHPDYFSTATTSILYSFGRQSENKDELGLAVTAPLDEKTSTQEAPKGLNGISDTHLMLFPIKAGKITYRFYSCWSLTDPGFRDESFFKQFLLSQPFNAPLEIK